MWSKALVVIAEEKVSVDGNSAKKIDLLYFTYYNYLSIKNTVSRNHHFFKIGNGM
jgi:hypothetical protein